MSQGTYPVTGEATAATLRPTPKTKVGRNEPTLF